MDGRPAATPTQTQTTQTPLMKQVNDILWGFLHHNGTLDQRMMVTKARTGMPMDIARVVREYDADVDINRLLLLVNAVVTSIARSGSQVPQRRLRVEGDYERVLRAHQPERRDMNPITNTNDRYHRYHLDYPVLGRLYMPNQIWNAGFFQNPP
jgi:hypothetical protein